MPPFETDLRRSFEPRASLIGDSVTVISATNLTNQIEICWAARRWSGSVAFGQFRDHPHGRNGGNNDMEGAAERALTVGAAAHTPLSLAEPASF
jgi:hypothetical protein